MHTEPLSTERKRATKLGYLTGIITAVVLLLLYPVFAPHGWTAFLPTIVGIGVYFGWRILTGDLDKETVVNYLNRKWKQLGQ